MACFHVIPISLMSGGDHPCAHYLHYMPYYGLFSCDPHILDVWWRSPLCSLLALPLCSMTHYDITMGHDVVRDAIVTQQWVTTLLGTSIVTSQWIMTLRCVHNMASQWMYVCIITLLWTSFAMYCYAKLWYWLNYTKLWYCCFTSKLFKIIHISH